MEFATLLRVGLVDTPEGVQALSALFARVAAEEGWQPDGDITTRHERSVHFGLWTEHGELAGGVQLIRAGEDGLLPCHRVWPELDITYSSMVRHVTVLAVNREWRGRNAASAFWLLCTAMWRHCVEQGVRELWLEATPKMLRCYRLLGWPLVMRGELREHWGEPCYLCSLSVREAAGALAEKAVRSRTYSRIVAVALQYQTPCKND